MKPYYEDGSVTIYHGDALEVLPRIPTSTVDAVITDPPYVIGAVSAGNMNSKSGGWADMMNSALWFTHWYREIDRVLRASNACFWTFLNWRTVPVVMRAALDSGFPVTSLLVWDKETLGPTMQGLRPSYELVALMARPDFQIRNRSLSDVWRCPRSMKENGHPAEKPLPLLVRLIEASRPAVGVLDPFMGSGTAAVAAKSLGVPFVGIEAEEKWCELAANRCSQEVLLIGDAA